MLSVVTSPFVKTLKEYLENNASVLNYDGRQFYAHLYNFLESKERGESDEELFGLCKNPPVRTLIPLKTEEVTKEVNMVQIVEN